LATTQSATDKQSASLFQTLTGQCSLTRTTEARTDNKVLPKAEVTSIYDTFVLNRTLVFQINSSAKAPRYRKPPNHQVGKIPLFISFYQKHLFKFTLQSKWFVFSARKNQGNKLDCQ
jgi:hypothetical protein